MNQPFEFRVWDKPNGIFLTELQTDFGEWVWTRGSKHDTGKSSWHWIFNHPDDFVVTQYIGKEDENKKKIFGGDILHCWSETGLQVNGGPGAEGVVEYLNCAWVLRVENGIYLPDWQYAEHIIVIGNMFENFHKAKALTNIE